MASAADRRAGDDAREAAADPNAADGDTKPMAEISTHGSAPGMVRLTERSRKTTALSAESCEMRREACDDMRDVNSIEKQQIC